MAKCKECRYFRQDLGMIEKGICTYGRKTVSKEETTSGIEMDVVEGYQINREDEACEHFESRRTISRREWLAEGR